MKPFPSAPLDVHVVDVWPPGHFDAAVRFAYREAAAAGRIKIERTLVDSANGCTVVRYFADIPAQWIRAELGEGKRRWQGDQIPMEVIQQ